VRRVRVHLGKQGDGVWSVGRAILNVIGVEEANGDR
jgi:hypothetical protein